jgi:hypothetical protein
MHHVDRFAKVGQHEDHNLIALCVLCHRFVHIAERRLPLIARVMLAVHIIGPSDSPIVTRVCWFLFRRFLLVDPDAFQLARLGEGRTKVPPTPRDKAINAMLLGRCSNANIDASEEAAVNEYVQDPSIRRDTEAA